MLKPGWILFCISIITGGIGWFLFGTDGLLVGYLTPSMIYFGNKVK